MTPCPHCGGDLEVAIDLWCKEVELDTTQTDFPQLVDCSPTGCADTDAGLFFESEHTKVSCQDCGKEVPATFDADFLKRRWVYLSETDLGLVERINELAEEIGNTRAAGLADDEDDDVRLAALVVELGLSR
jgi:hypothetical protein